MRWSYLIPRLIIIGILWAFMAFGFDPLLKYSATETLQAMIGAKADVNELKTGFFPPRFSIDSVALANHRKPGTNLVQFDQMRFGLAGDPLLRRAFVVDEAVVTGVRFGTVRNDSGQLEISPDDEPSGPIIPPWLSEKIRNAGDEWLEEFTQQAKQRLDPNTLESYRVGNELYGKWDARFKEINVQLDTAKTELDIIKRQIDAAKEGKTVEQIEQYLEVARRADLLMRQSRALLLQFKSNVPLELRRDFERLDQARKNDQAMAANAIHLLKPDSRRITESLMGEEMYLQLQQLLSWVEAIRSYQQELKAPPAPERHRGRDFEFEVWNPTPRILCRKMLLSGELMLSDTPTPFSAELTDVTSDPKLHGRPVLLRVSTKGETPVDLVIRHDATSELSTTDLGVDYTDRSAHEISAGKANGDQLVASISDMHWTARLTLTEDRISGQVDIASRFGQPKVNVKNELAMSLAQLAESTLEGISTVNARLQIAGTIRKPQLTVTSDLGEQVVSGFESAFTNFVPQVKAMLTAQVSTFVDRQKQEFTDKYGAKYQEVLGRHQNIIDGLDQAHQLAMDLRSGNVDPNKVFRLASETGVLKEKDQEKVDKYLDKGNDVLKGLQSPEKTIQDALPGLRKKLFR